MINLLVLSVVYSGCAVPLVWFILDKPGNSDTYERIALLQEFIELFGLKKIAFVTADREFIGQEWIAWLIEMGIAFRIRIKANEYLIAANGEKRRASQWFSSKFPESAGCKARSMHLWGLSVFVAGKRLAKPNQFLIVISNEIGNRLSDLLEEYRLRWKIETLFQALKGRGFDMEASRLTDWSRLWAWFGFLALALAWCLKTGEFLDRSSRMVMKNHGRRAQSVFRRGLDYLQRTLAPLTGTTDMSQFLCVAGLLRPERTS